VLVKLAERTQALRFLIGSETASGDARAHAARETLDLFAPPANRLGVWACSSGSSGSPLRALEPEAYQRIARTVDERLSTASTTSKASAGRSSASLPPPT